MSENSQKEYLKKVIAFKFNLLKKKLLFLIINYEKISLPV